MDPIRISLIEGCCKRGSYWAKGSSWLSWSHHFESFTVSTMTWLTAMEYLCPNWRRISPTCHKHFPVPSSFMTYHLFITRLTRRVPLVEQELLTLPEHLSSLPVFSGVRVIRSLALYVCFIDRCLSICIFFFGPLRCLFFFNIRILITPLVSSNSSYWAFQSLLQQWFTVITIVISSY